MTYHITAPSHVRATISLPASKSISNRALILHALAQGSHTPCNLSDCDDTNVMVKALATNKEPQTTSKAPCVIDIKAAGTAMRFLTAYFSVSPGYHLLTGTERMQHRPISILVDTLRKLGADIEYASAEGFPPLLIRGHDPGNSAPSTASTLSLPGSVSSQYISALLMIAPLLPQGLRLELTGAIISRPYIDLTLSLMRDFGAEAKWVDRNTLTVEPGHYHDISLSVESDWSAASYWYEIVALNAHQLRLHPQPITDGEAHPTPSVELLGLYADSHQGDCRVADYFGRLGLRTEYTEQGVRISPMGLPVARFIEDLNDTPDLAQTLVVTCCLMGIPFRLSGLQSLRIKETDRIAALQTEMHRLGYVVREEQAGLLVWNGERSPVQPEVVIQTYDDHRMAMAFAPVALTGSTIGIDQPEVVTKSYPAFWDHLRQAGFAVDAC